MTTKACFWAWILMRSLIAQGTLSLFYPPDPRGIPKTSKVLIIPSFLLTLLREAIQLRSLIEVLKSGIDSHQQRFSVDEQGISQIETLLDEVLPENPVQWYLVYHTMRELRQALYAL